jgi:hypothetical protein
VNRAARQNAAAAAPLHVQEEQTAVSQEQGIKRCSFHCNIYCGNPAANGDAGRIQPASGHIRSRRVAGFFRTVLTPLP